jgi:hypothetical protein
MGVLHDSGCGESGGTSASATVSSVHGLARRLDPRGVKVGDGDGHGEGGEGKGRLTDGTGVVGEFGGESSAMLKAPIHGTGVSWAAFGCAC